MRRAILINILPALFLVSLSTLSFASTNVPSTLSGDTQWTRDGSPYVVQGKALVPKGATLRIDPGVKVVFQGPAALEVDGDLEVQGSAAAPAVFDMTQAGLHSEIFLNGAEAHIVNSKFSSGVFLARDCQLTMEGSEVTRGSGVYLQGDTTARLKSNKIYGNAAGVVLDGTVKASLQFNTLVENGFGLYLKGFSSLSFKYNSVHDNQKEVVNNTPILSLGGNYWGTTDASVVQAKIQGKVDLPPLKSLNDVLRYYVRTQLPVITKEMSLALAAKEKREAKEEALVLKKMKGRQAPAQPPAEVPAPEASAPAAEAPAPAPSAEQAASTGSELPPPPEETTTGTTAQASAPEAAAPAPAETAAAPLARTITVKSLPPAPHRLKPLAHLPPDQGDVSTVAAAPLPTGNGAAEEAPAAAAPEVPQPSPAAASSSTSPSEIPLPPGAGSEKAAPAAAENNPTEQVPVPPEVSGSTPAPPSLDDFNPPSVETSTAPAPPPVPSTSNEGAAKTSSNGTESVPAPPDLNEQVAPAASNSSAPPAPEPSSPAAPEAAAPPPAAASSTEAPPAPPVNTAATEDQTKAVQSLQGVNGDIDGMQAPPLDLGSDLANPSSSAPSTAGSGQPSSGNSNSDLALPPIPDSDVQPPKDLDLPPTDDLGNINLDSRNK